jgi:hypothetical protein
LLYLAEEKNGLGSLDIGLREDITHVLHFYHGTDARPQLNKFYYIIISTLNTNKKRELFLIKREF